MYCHNAKSTSEDSPVAQCASQPAKHSCPNTHAYITARPLQSPLPDYLQQPRCPLLHPTLPTRPQLPAGQTGLLHRMLRCLGGLHTHRACRLVTLACGSLWGDSGWAVQRGSCMWQTGGLEGQEGGRQHKHSNRVRPLAPWANSDTQTPATLAARYASCPSFFTGQNQRQTLVLRYVMLLMVCCVLCADLYVLRWLHVAT